MSLAGHQPPPIFRRGPTPLARLMIYVIICLGLLVADLRFRYLDVLRQGLSVVTWPLQMAAATPADFVRNASSYFATLVDLQLENRKLRAEQLMSARDLLRMAHLERENAALRALVNMNQRVEVVTQGAEILYDAPDPFARRVIIDRGSQHGVETGLAAVDALGVIGQVTRVYPVQSEVTLVTDRNQAISVEVQRTGQRGVLFGTGPNSVEMRYVLAGADIVPGDRLVTSGIDGVFVAGLPVARVTEVARDGEAYARISAVPVAAVEQSLQILLLGREALPPPPPAD